MSGWSTRADIPISVGSAAKARSATPFNAMPPVTARASRARERLLQQPGRHDERRAEEEEETPAGLRRAAGEQVEPMRIGGDGLPAARQRQRHRRDEREPDELDGELHEVDVGAS